MYFEYLTYFMYLLVHSEWKNRSKFLTPQKSFFWFSFSILDLWECIMAIIGPPDPWGGPGGGMGGQRGSMRPKIATFRGATFWFQNVKFWIVWTENTLFSRFWAKRSPSGDQKWPFLAEISVHKSAFFWKTPSCLKMHHNKVLGSILMWEKFGVPYPWKNFHDKKMIVLPALTSPLEKSDPATFK